MTAILARASERKNFHLREGVKERGRKNSGLLGTFWFELWDGEDPETATLVSATGEHFDKKDRRDKALDKLVAVMAAIDHNEGLHLVEHILLRAKLDQVHDEVGKPVEVAFPLICLDNCDLGIGLGEETGNPQYQKHIRRIPAEKCYDKMPWVLEYFRQDPTTSQFDQSLLWQQAAADRPASVELKFRRYEHLATRVRELHEFGSERIDYEILSNQAVNPAKLKYGFIIRGSKNAVLAQSLLVFNKSLDSRHSGCRRHRKGNGKASCAISGSSSTCIAEANPFDDDDPYSFRTTVVLPCWPKRLRDPHLPELGREDRPGGVPRPTYTPTSSG